MNVAPKGAGGIANLFVPAVPKTLLEVDVAVGVVTVELGRDDENVVVDGFPVPAMVVPMLASVIATGS